MEVSWLVLAVMAAVSVSQTGAVNVTIIPKRASTIANGSVSLMCDIGLAANGCVFNVWLHNYKGVHTDIKQIDLGHGKASGTFQRPESNTLFQAEYQGQGLDMGQCGLKMFGLTPGLYFVGCRVRSATGGWTYDHMALVVHSGDKFQANSQGGLSEMDFERVEINQTKRSQSIDFTLKQSNGKCDLFVIYETDPTENNKTHTKLDKFSMKRREKTVTFLVTSNKIRSGGVMWCFCWETSSTDFTDFTEFDVKILTVLKSPGRPELMVSKTNYTKGETLTATCVSKFARPVAKIVWNLGDKVIRNDTDDDNVDERRLDIDLHDEQEPRGDWPWRWPWSTRSIKQVLNHSMLTLEDNGKELSCQVLHPALANGYLLSNSSTITVEPGNVNSANGSNTIVVVGAIMAAVVLALLAGAAICWMRKKRVAETTGNRQHSDDTSFIVDNDLYQSQSAARFNNHQSPGARPSYQAENPYDELTPALTGHHAQAAPSSVYNNMVQYAEVVVGSNHGDQPPPKKPFKEEACLYAEITKDNKPPPKTPLNPDVVYAQVVKGRPAGSKPPPKPPAKTAVNPEAVYAEVIRKNQAKS